MFSVDSPLFRLFVGLIVTAGLNGLVRMSRGDEPKIELVKESALTEGAGLAASRAKGASFENDPRVLFVEDFEDSEYAEHWDEVRNPNQSVLALVDESSEASHLGKHSLKVSANLDRDTGGGLTKWYQPCDPVFIRFYTKFAVDCDYVHHFCTLRANESLSGSGRWSGFGGAGELPEGDSRFSTAIEPWGNWGKWAPPGRWNFYSYWHEMKPSPDGKYWGNSFAIDEQAAIPRGQWICVEMMLKHNTPNQADGEQAFWIDGKLIGHWRGFNWRTSESLWANAFTLESYITDRWTKQTSNAVLFDNVVIAKEYVGPAVP